MKKKILVSDYDQTFYLNDEDIEKNKEAVKKFREDGNIFVIATGRSYFDFHNKLDIYNFSYDYVIINHGATILDNNDNVLVNYSIDNSVVDKIKQDLNLDKVIDLFCCSELESRVSFEYKDLTKIHTRYNNESDAMKVNDIINSKYSTYVNSYFVNKNSIEITSNKTNKSKAINFLSDKLNIGRNDIYTIGDNYSDIEMIKDFNGYAMKNSVEKLKEFSIKEYDSVSKLIEEL